MLRAFLAGVLSLMIVYAPVLPAANRTPLGQVSATGPAEINGAIVSTATTVFSGDIIATRQQAVATLKLSGGDEVLFPERSKAAVMWAEGRPLISLAQGGMAVMLRNVAPLVVRANGARIEPGTSGALYEVVVRGTQLEVLARQGTVLVKDAKQTITVPQGQELKATMASAATGQVSQPLGTVTVWLLVAGAAAGIAGLVLGVAAFTRKQPQDCKVVSPSGQIVCP